MSKQSGSLVITSGKGDITDANNNAENILLQSANTDWTVETKLVCSKKPTGSQNAGIVAYQNDDNFVKLVYSAGAGRRGPVRPGSAGEQSGSVDLLVESKGNQKFTVSLSLNGIIKENNTLILKLVKKGSNYTASCSSDGVEFKPVGSTDIILKDISAGVIVCNGVSAFRMGGNFQRSTPQTTQPESSFDVAFDYFKIMNSGLK